MGDEATPFSVDECEMGCWACTAWNDWLWACHAADPAATEEGRDPDCLAGHDFHPPHCHRPGSCPLFARSMKVLHRAVRS
jgi:hypothetical protein